MVREYRRFAETGQLNDAQIFVGVEESPKLRLRCHYSYSDRERFVALKDEWFEYIEGDI